MESDSQLHLIDILLPTYNGEKYLSEQIDSILRQDFKNWRLLIRDDGSSDSTISIINEYKNRYPENISILSNIEGNIGPVRSFLILMEKSSASYIAFCDQDDVWVPNKLEKQLNILTSAEKRHGVQCPMLVHSDLNVVDENLNLLSNSLWKYQKLNPAKMVATEKLLLQNCVTGCATLINRSLLKLALSIQNPEKIIMHDWWLALVVTARGEIFSMPESTVLYRQHSGNDTGAVKWGLPYMMTILKHGPDNLRARVQATKVQAEELLDVGILQHHEEIVVKQFVEMFRLNWLDRRIEMVKNGYLKYGAARNLAVFLVI